MAAMRADYAALKADPGGPWADYTGYDAWFDKANNAALALQAAYDSLVPGFERLFHQQGDDFARFHAAVRRLAALPPEQRLAELSATP
jgi:predicted aminopeptidase